MASDAHTHIPDAVRAQLVKQTAQRDEIDCALADPDTFDKPERVRELSQRKAVIEPLVDRYTRLVALESEAVDLREIAVGGDVDLAALAREELPKVEARIASLTAELIDRLVTADDDAVTGVILEIRAGVGGDEAALWARDILDMYEKYAAHRRWALELLDVSTGADAGGRAGVKTAVASVTGAGVWSELSHETGTHCVKRVPATEAQGRIHTSTATVAVLPEPREVELTVDPHDVEEHITTARGPGGQNVNKVATAVHLIHKPTGVEVRMQEAKSQRQNREKAWRLLRARLYDIEREKQERERAHERSKQIGSAGRSERVRTYRYKDSIAVDHRLSSDTNTFNLQTILAGDLDALHAALNKKRIDDRLAAM